MPAKSAEQIVDYGSRMYSYLAPFALSFLMPVFVYTLVHEKQQRLREMMKMMGLKMTMYWMINYVYDALLYFIAVLLFFCIGLAFGIRVFTQTSSLIQFLVYVGWGFSQVSLSFFISCFFSKSRNSTLGTYLLVIFSIITGIIWNVAAFPVSDGTIIPWAIMLYPPWAVYRAFCVMGTQCSNMLCLDELTDEVRAAVLILWLSAPILLIVAIYLDEVLPHEFGVRKHPLFFVEPLYRMFSSRGTSKVAGNMVQEVDESAGGVASERPQEVIDEDVIAESSTVNVLYQKQGAEEEAPVLVKNVRKEYGEGKTKKVAVSGVSLHVEKNECFGLLGPNGAGKTTLISVLTGMFSASGGSAKIAGFDVGTQMDEIQKVLGVCPQFDTLWPELTPLETLVFYARMRGLAGRDAYEASHYLLQSVGLESVELRQVSALSGGMRRRLSIAIALVGDPKVLFFDEPTTGLDVVTRRELWDVLIAAQVGRSTILTTHSMEEADALCQRISIIAFGKMCAIGTNVHLKDKFGGGYSIHVSFKPDDEQRVDDFISSVAPGVVVSDSLKGLKTYRLPPGTSVAGLFRTMVASQVGGIIINWGLAQATLEDVFLALVRGGNK